MAKLNRLAEQKPAAEADDAEIIEEYSTSESLERLLTETGAGAENTKVHVYLINAETREEPKIWSGSTDDYDLDTLAKHFGSGRYRVKAYGNHPVSNKYALLLNQVIPCLLTAEEDARLKAMREGKPLPGESPALSPEAVRLMIADAVRAAQPVQQPQNQLGLIREVADIVRTMLPAHHVPAAPSAPVDPLAMIRSLASAMREMQPSAPLEGGSNAGPLDVILKLVDKFGPLYGDAMKAQMAGAGAGNAPQLSPPGADLNQPAGVAHAAPPVQPSAEADAMLRFKMGLAFLVEQAKLDNDPATYASVIVDNVPAEDLAALLAAPDWIGGLAAFAPDVAKHAEWFNELKDEVKGEITERQKAPLAPATGG